MPVLHAVDIPGPRPDGEPIVFLGSVASSTDMWLGQLDALSRHRRVIALDHRGHGASPIIPGPATMADLAGDVLETLDSLGVDRFAVVGLSLGGAVAQQLAATSPRVTRVALLCTGAYFGGEDKWGPRMELAREQGVAPLAETTFSLWATPIYRETHPATSAWYRQMIAATSTEGYLACAAALAGWDNDARLPEITVPVLTLAGEHDQSTPPAALAVLAQGVSGPVTSVVLAGAHLPTIESGGQVAAVLERFLR